VTCRELVRPMLAIPGELPGAYEDGLWAYELKKDLQEQANALRDLSTSRAREDASPDVP
jgi:hypothetical protein